ncbi:MAG: hypothetical protein RLZZ296_1015 [Pseudomonadota bacterium]|jgi:hypothetical protein
MQNPDLTKPAVPEGAKLRNAVLILWPSFLAACMLEGVVFAMVDPGEINWPGLVPQPSRQGVYTVAFFTFWSITMACCSLVLWLGKPELQVNDEALSD